MGKTISDVQTSVTFDEAAGKAAGTLKYISNWTQFSPNPTYNTGNFIAFKVGSAPAGATISASLVGHIDPTRDEWVTDADGEFIFQITDKAAQKIRVKIAVGGVETIAAFDLNDLMLETE